MLWKSPRTVQQITSFEDGDEATNTPSAWTITTDTNEFGISTASSDALDGARALVHPNGADFEGMYSQPGDGLDYYPSYQDRHRLHFKMGTTSDVWNWRFLRGDGGNNLQCRIECGSNAVRLSENVGGTLSSPFARIENGTNGISFSFSAGQWYALDPWTASSHTAGIELFEYDRSTDVYSSLGSDTGTFDASLDGFAGVEIFCAAGAPRYVFDDFHEVAQS